MNAQPVEFRHDLVEQSREDKTGTYSVIAGDAEKSTILGPVSLPAAVAIFAPGTLLQGRYRLDRELGRGGMGLVFLGHDERLERPVAVKVILPVPSGANDNDHHAEAVQNQFFEEARIGANLLQPSMATVFDFGTHEGLPFTVFEYIPGETLKEALLRRGRLPLEEVQLIIGPLAQALDFAHARHVIHRDLKPANIKATASGQFKILDLGLATEFRRRSDWCFAGTPAYASPEQAAGLPCDGRTDQYALALIAFEMLAGRRLFVSKTPFEVLEMHRVQVPTVRESDLGVDSRNLVTALRKAFSKDPADRFATCEDFALALGCQFLTHSVFLPEILKTSLVVKMSGQYRAGGIATDLQRSRRPCLLLATDAVWCRNEYDIMRWPLEIISSVDRDLTGKILRLILLSTKNKEKVVQSFHFSNRNECQEWVAELQDMVASVQMHSNVHATGDPKVSPIVVIDQRPSARYQSLGNLEFVSTDRSIADGAARITAAMFGGDAISSIQMERLVEFSTSKWRLTGSVLRAVDAQGRRELVMRWYNEAVMSVTFWMVIMIVVQITLGVRETAESFVDSAEIFKHAVMQYENGGLGSSFDVLWEYRSPVALGLFNLVALVMPIALALSLRILRWPQLLTPTAVAFFPFLFPLGAYGSYRIRRLQREYRSLIRADDIDVPRHRRLIANMATAVAIAFWGCVLFCVIVAAVESLTAFH